MHFDIQKETGSIIKVIGVGGGGSNAVNHMFKQGIIGVDFAICNTDNQAMDASPIPTQIQLGPTLTEGRGAGSKPNIGRESCLESIEEVKQFIGGDTKMLFVTAGMGGGTGTGAAPIIAKAAQEMDILTVGIVTIPFTFEGRRRKTQAMEGLEELKKNVDALIIISNDRLREIYGNLSLSDAFSNADDILTTAAKGIAEIITVTGYVNVDFEDVNTVMRGSGVAIMGTAGAEGDNRARKAVEGALNSPLLEENNIQGANHILLNITSGKQEVTMDEIYEITEYVQEEAGFGTDLIWGNNIDETIGDKLIVTVIATGFEGGKGKEEAQEPVKEQIVVSLDDAVKEDTEPVYETGLNQGEKPLTVEFDTGNTNKSRYSYDNPYVKDDEIKEERKVEKLEPQPEARVLPMIKLNNPDTIQDLENQPAYMRRDIELDEVPDSAQSSISKWTLSEDRQIIQEKNPFLHDNVD